MIVGRYLEDLTVRAMQADLRRMPQLLLSRCELLCGAYSGFGSGVRPSVPTNMSHSPMTTVSHYIVGKKLPRFRCGHLVAGGCS